jgi:hypothetical protein
MLTIVKVNPDFQTGPGRVRAQPRFGLLAGTGGPRRAMENTLTRAIWNFLSRHGFHFNRNALT